MACDGAMCPWNMARRRPSPIGKAVGRQGHLHPDDGGAGLQRWRGEGHHDRRDLPESAPHGFAPAGDKVETDDKRGPHIGCRKGGLNTMLHAVTDAKGRPLRFFMTAGQTGDNTGAAALLSSRPAAEGLITDREYDADWFGDTLKDRGYALASRARSPAAGPSATTSGDTIAETGSRSCSAGQRTGAGSPRATTGPPKPSSPPSPWPQPSCSGFDDQ